MERQFYSYRRGRREPLSGPFFTAYETMLERLIRVLQFPKYFIDYSDDSFDCSPAEAKLKELIGTPWTPLGYYRNITKPKEDAQVLDVVEAFRELSSKQRSRVDQLSLLHCLRINKNGPSQADGRSIDKVRCLTGVTHAPRAERRRRESRERGLRRAVDPYNQLHETREPRSHSPRELPGFREAVGPGEPVLSGQAQGA